MRFSVKSVSTGKLYFAIWSYSHHTTWQTGLKYTQLFDLIPEILGYTTPTLYAADAPWSQLSKNRIISDQCYVRLEKIAAACDEPARNWDRGPKISIFQSNPVHRALIQNRPKTCKNQDFSNRTRFFEKIPRAACTAVVLTVRRPKHPCLVWCTTIILYETFSRLVPRDPNWGDHSKQCYL